MFSLDKVLSRYGNFLFRVRSYLMILLVPFIIMAFPHSESIDLRYGETAQLAWELFCIAVALTGLLLRALTLGWIAYGTSMRSTTAIQTAGLNTDGMYSVVRPPLYLGNFLIVLGVLMFVEVWQLVAVYFLFFFVCYGPILFAEENFLKEKFVAAFEAWHRSTPAMIPNFKLWKAPRSTFSLKKVLRREYHGVLAMVVGFVVMKFFSEWIGEHELEFRWHWGFFLGAALTLYLTLHFEKKRSRHSLV